MNLIKDYQTIIGLQPGAAAHLAVAAFIEQYAQLTHQEHDRNEPYKRIATARTAAVKNIIKGITYHLDEHTFERPLEVTAITTLDDLAQLHGRLITHNLASPQDILRTLVNVNNPYRHQCSSKRLIATPEAIALIDGAWNTLKSCYEQKQQYEAKRP